MAYDDAAEANKSSDPMGALMERRKYKGQSFASAFREARGSGDKTFFWNGKKYNTDLVPAKPVPPEGKNAPTAATSRGVRSESTAPPESKNAPTAATSRGAGRGYKLSDVERPGTRVRYDNEDTSDMTYKKGGSIKGYAKGGSVRGSGCEQRSKKCKVY